MISTLIWKEWREKRMFILILSVLLVLGYILSINHIIVPKEVRTMDEMLFMFMFAISLFVGGNAVSPELKTGTMNFVLSQPVSRTKIWTVKYISTIAIFTVFILLNLGLEFLMEPPLNYPSFSFRQSAVALDWNYYIWDNVISKLLLYSVLMFGSFLFSCFMRSSIAAMSLFLVATGITTYVVGVIFNKGDVFHSVIFLCKGGIVLIMSFSLLSWMEISKTSYKKTFIVSATTLFLALAVALFPFKESRPYSNIFFQLQRKIYQKYEKNLERIKEIQIENLNEAKLLIGFTETFENLYVKEGSNYSYSSHKYYSDINKSKDKIEAYKKAISLAPNEAIYYMRFILHMIPMRRWYNDNADEIIIKKYSIKELIPILEKSKRLDSGNAMIDYIYAYLHLQAGDIDKAMQLIENASKKKYCNTYQFEAWHAEIEMLKYLGIPESDALILSHQVPGPSKEDVIDSLVRGIRGFAEKKQLLHQYDKAEKYYAVLLTMKSDLYSRRNVYRDLRELYILSKNKVPKYIDENLGRIKQEIKENEAKIKQEKKTKKYIRKTRIYDLSSEQEIRDALYKKFHDKN